MIGNKLHLLVMIFLIAIGFFLSFRFPEKNLFTLSSLERDTMLKRDGYLRIGTVGQIYGRKIGNFYFNRFNVYSNKIIKKISIPLDPIKYVDSQKRSGLLYFVLPFFLAGFIFFIKDYWQYFIIYFFLASIFCCFIVVDKTIILYYPLFTVLACLGIKKISNLILKNKK